MVTQVVDDRELVTRDFLAVCGAAGDGKEDHARAAASSGVGWHGGLVPPKAEIANTIASTPSFTGNGGGPLLAMVPACSSTYQLMGQTSVCTIDKVKLALDRLNRRSPGTGARRGQPDGSSATSHSSSLTSVSVKRRREENQEEDSAGSGSAMVASACPRCLLYVLTSREDPRCPRCHSHVPAPAAAAAAAGRRTKPCFDLNAETQSSFLGST